MKRQHINLTTNSRKCTAIKQKYKRILWFCVCVCMFGFVTMQKTNKCVWKKLILNFEFCCFLWFIFVYVCVCVCLICCFFFVGLQFYMHGRKDVWETYVCSVIFFFWFFLFLIRNLFGLKINPFVFFLLVCFIYWF